MKTDLSHLPTRKQVALERIVAGVHEEFGEEMKLATSQKRKAGRIEKIVLYGSHAREDWVEDHASGFMSDYDLLVIVNSAELTDSTSPWLENTRDRFLRENMRREADGSQRPEVSLIVHTLHEVNDNLARGRYFFCDILKEGIALYEQEGSKPFVKPGPVDEAAALAEAREAYEEWMPNAESALSLYSFGVKEHKIKDATFMLHQAAERLYTCISLVFTLYSPQTHNIERLRSRCESLDARLIEVWPRANRKDRAAFNKLKEAYVKARYSKQWEITAEELDWLGERVKHLQQVAKRVCEERLDGNF